MSFLLYVSVSLLVLAGSLVENNLTGMATNYTTVNSDVWNSDTGAGGVWSPDGTAPYHPLSGDQVTFNNQTIAVNSPQAFGGVGTASTLTNTASGIIQSTGSGGTIFGNAIDRMLVNSGLVQTLGGTLSIAAPTENNLGETIAAKNGTLNINSTLSNSGSQSAADPVNGNNLTLGSSAGVDAIPAQDQQFSRGKAAPLACLTGSLRQTDKKLEIVHFQPATPRELVLKYSAIGPGVVLGSTPLEKVI